MKSLAHPSSSGMNLMTWLPSSGMSGLLTLHLFFHFAPGIVGDDKFKFGFRPGRTRQVAREPSPSPRTRLQQGTIEGLVGCGYPICR